MPKRVASVLSETTEDFNKPGSAHFDVYRSIVATDVYISQELRGMVVELWNEITKNDPAITEITKESFVEGFPDIGGFREKMAGLFETMLGCMDFDGVSIF